MGKYGNGVSMKTAIEAEVADAEMLLQDQPEEVREEILDIIKEMAFQWCQSNALLCVLENIAREVIDEYEQQKFRSVFIRRYYEEVQDKISETYPF